jgi:protein involved in polysaccharide export with SLBB domain
MIDLPATVFVSILLVSSMVLGLLYHLASKGRERAESALQAFHEACLTWEAKMLERMKPPDEPRYQVGQKLDVTLLGPGLLHPGTIRVEIDAAGEIDIPQLGRVYAKDLTKAELDAILRHQIWHIQRNDAATGAKKRTVG